MNAPRRAVIARQLLLNAIGKQKPHKELSGGEMRRLARQHGLTQRRPHSNRNRNKQNQKRANIQRLARQRERMQ